MNTLKMLMTLTLLLVLTACSGLTTTPLETGVDEFGPYTVILEEGLSGTGSNDGLQPQQTLSSSGGSIRTVQLRKYSGNRYGTWLIIESKNSSVDWTGKLTVRFIGGGKNATDRTLSTRTYLPRWQTWGGNTGALSPDRDSLSEVCAMVEGSFSSRTSSGGYENSETYFRACKEV